MFMLTSLLEDSSENEQPKQEKVNVVKNWKNQLIYVKKINLNLIFRI